MVFGGPLGHRAIYREGNLPSYPPGSSGLGQSPPKPQTPEPKTHDPEAVMALREKPLAPSPGLTQDQAIIEFSGVGTGSHVSQG